jgi:hypothetical protein
MRILLQRAFGREADINIGTRETCKTVNWIEIVYNWRK